MVPVIWKLTSMTGIPSVVIISNTPDILGDFRIQFLNKLDNLEIHLIDEFIPPKSTQYDNSAWSIRILYMLFRRIVVRRGATSKLIHWKGAKSSQKMIKIIK